MDAPRRISVFVVDDSAVVRQVMTQLLADDPHIELIGTASDPVFAQTRLRQRWPDVIVLDIEMPRMDGLSFLRQIMAERPTPVVICSSLAESGSKTAMEALAAGAVGIITKPKGGLRGFLEDAANDLRSAIKAAAASNVRLLRVAPLRPPPRLDASAILPPLAPATAAPTPTALARTTERVIAIGTSTGGTQALDAVLSRLPESIAGIVVVQHMPEKFTAMFADRLDEICRIRVREARNGDRVLPGSALIAPGGRHMLLRRSGAQYSVEVRDGPVVNRHKPSVDVLFRSVATVAGANAVGVIMTGMGDDGARGLKEMRDAGAPTVAQDEASCVVFGMPKEAIKLGAADEVVPLLDIPAALVRLAAG